MEKPPRSGWGAAACGFICLFCEDLLQSCEAGQAVFLFELRLALDQRHGVLDEVFRHVVALRGDPLGGELLLEVGDIGQVKQLGLAGVAVRAVALEADHLVRLTSDHLLNSGLTGHERFFDVGAGGAVRRAALQQAQLDAADLRAGALFHNAGQRRGQTAQLGMAEAVGRGSLRLGDEAAVGIVDALGDGDDAVLLLFIALGNVGDKLVHVEVDLRQIDEVAAGLCLVGKRGGGGQPARVAAHALDDGDHAGVIDVRVAGDFHDGRGDILGCGSVAGAVVGTEEVVVDGLGDTHDAALVADLLHILGDLVAGIHGVVAAVVAEIADVVLLEDLKNALVIGIVLIRVLDLVAAGAERGGRRVGQAVKLGTVFLVHAQQFVVQNALDAVVRAVDLRDAVCVERGTDAAVGAGIDDSGRAAGLADDQSALQSFRHNNYLHIRIRVC